ncbi:DUF551 domain-containing protein [Zhenpiania hominis]|uniref:DUF551 domain-containing protein n=1 Tax=Zhenpiania hominis TaxID=2763644 RepID=A0A923NRL9_9FIRM|nr:DUF551 domain-containing protein [Zhenpiania hominis]MBC6681440.1 DUF551 domain-containing protein [Zhenpiania hominis]
MIDEKKLIEKTEHYIKRYLEPPYGREIEGTVELLKEVKDVLSEQPKAGAWIPCSEKLPENDYDTVMVFLDSKIYDIAIWHNEHGFRPWYAAHFEASPPEWKACVTAWMPLPEPWKGDLK